MIFNSGETKKSINIDIVDDNEYNLEEAFELELYDVIGGAVGKINKAKVTIDDDDGNKLYSNQTLFTYLEILFFKNVFLSQGNVVQGLKCTSRTKPKPMKYNPTYMVPILE